MDDILWNYLRFMEHINYKIHFTQKQLYPSAYFIWKFGQWLNMLWKTSPIHLSMPITAGVFMESEH